MSDMNYFLLRRLHSLLGVFPLGVFLFNHLLTNSTGILGTEQFEHKVALIHMLGPLLPFVEAILIFVPLSLHIALGVYIAMTAKMENRLPYGRNWAYKFQRWTGWIALVYIAYHAIHLRFVHDMDAAPFSFVLAHMFTGPLAIIWVPFYLIGGLAVVYHFANGLCTFCMSWGITVGPRSQAGMAKLATAIGAVMTLMLLASIIGFAREGIEYRRMDEQQKAQLVERIREHHPSVDFDKAFEYLQRNFGG